MKKSTAKTGNQYQDWCFKTLQKIYPGASVFNQKAVARFLPYINRWVSSRNDIFGCDIICLVPFNKPLFVQCTTHKSFNEKLKELNKYSWCLDHISVQVWLKRSPGRTEIRQLAFDGGIGILVPAGEVVRGKFISPEATRQS